MNEGRPGEIAKAFRRNPNTGKREFGNLVVVRATSDSNTRPSLGRVALYVGFQCSKFPERTIRFRPSVATRLGASGGTLIGFGRY